MSRFVLLHHDAPRGAHWDLMLEDGPILATWALPEMPRPGMELDAERLFDHRPLFLDYEGPLSAGRGSVTRVAGGEYDTLLRTGNRWVVRLNSTLLEGELELTNTDPDQSLWHCRFETAIR